MQIVNALDTSVYPFVFIYWIEMNIPKVQWLEKPKEKKFTTIKKDEAQQSNQAASEKKTTKSIKLIEMNANEKEPKTT